MPQDTIAIVTVHGTGDTATSVDGTKWFQRGSAYTERVKQRLAAKGINAEIRPHLWSGANSAWDRERGANGLAQFIRRLYKDYDSIHVIGHSHGGNVANDAAVLLKWGLRKNIQVEKFDTLTTVGTPFLNVRTGWTHVLAGLLFLAIAWGSAILFPILAVAAIASEWTQIQGNVGMAIWFAAFMALTGWSVLFMLGMSRQGVRRILRPKAGGRTKTSVFSIWHKNDEAIAFLQRVEELPIEAFPRGAFFRGSRPMAVAIGVLTVIVLSVANPILYLLHLPNFLSMEQLLTEEAGANRGSAAVTIMVFGLFFAPLIFSIIYLLYRWLVGGAGEIGARGSMNRYVGGILRGIAFGRDGDQELCNVSTKSHTHLTEEHIIGGECATRMQSGAHDAAGKLIDKYRWALFQVGGDSSASLTTLTTDAMTWNSLIHTTYFDQPEVADVFADYVAAKVKGEAFAPAVAPPAPQPAPVLASPPQPEAPGGAAPQPA